MCYCEASEFPVMLSAALIFLPGFFPISHRLSNIALVVNEVSWMKWRKPKQKTKTLNPNYKISAFSRCFEVMEKIFNDPTLSHLKDLTVSNYPDRVLHSQTAGLHCGSWSFQKQNESLHYHYYTSLTFVFSLLSSSSFPPHALNCTRYGFLPLTWPSASS